MKREIEKESALISIRLSAIKLDGMYTVYMYLMDVLPLETHECNVLCAIKSNGTHLLHSFWLNESSG